MGAHANLQLFHIKSQICEASRFCQPRLGLSKATWDILHATALHGARLYTGQTQRRPASPPHPHIEPKAKA